MIRTACLWRLVTIMMAGLSTGCDQTDADAWLTSQQYRISQSFNLAAVPQDASGLSYDPDRNGLWLVSDDPATLYFLTLGGELIQTVRLEGFDDPESVTWIGSDPQGHSRLVLSEERRGRLVELLVNAETQSLEYDQAHLQLQMDKQGSNNGIEGLTYRAVDASLWFATEFHPQSVYRLDSAALTQVWEKSFWRAPRDYSGIVHIPQTDTLLLISDRNRVIVEHDLRGRVLAQLPIKDIPNPEGIAITAGGTIFICSEPNLLYKLVPTP